MSADQNAILQQVAAGYLQSGKLDQAEKAYKQVLARDSTNVQVLQQLAIVYQHQGKHEQALEILNEATSLDPTNAGLFMLLGNAHRNLGDLDTARATYLQLAEIEQTAVMAWYHFAAVTKFIDHDATVRQLEEVHAKLDENDPNRGIMAFALGKVFDDLKEFDRAFEYFREGNEIAKALKDPSPIDQESEGYTAVKQIFDEDFFRRHEVLGVDDPRPIIVTGLPRSGTTLVEQVLASHPEVHGAGELSSIPQLIVRMSLEIQGPFPVAFGSLDSPLIEKHANEYLAELRDLSQGAPFTTDKGIRNDIFIGLISAMLPNAKIVMCRRDPRDIGLSIYQKMLQQQDSWTNDLEEFGRVYRLFADLDAHWDRVLPGKIHRIQYEELIDDFEAHVRALLDYCGLPFDRACLDFYKTRRPVKTESHSQVRQPIYRGSIGKWKNYEQHVQPLIDILNTE